MKILQKKCRDIFSLPPWNDDWSEEEQLNKYILDLIDIRTAIPYRLFEDNEMVGLSLGHVKHWYTGTGYYINEFCVKPEKQGRGLGTQFMELNQMVYLHRKL